MRTRSFFATIASSSGSATAAGAAAAASAAAVVAVAPPPAAAASRGFRLAVKEPQRLCWVRLDSGELAQIKGEPGVGVWFRVVGWK